MRFRNFVFVDYLDIQNLKIRKFILNDLDDTKLNNVNL